MISPEDIRIDRFDALDSTHSYIKESLAQMKEKLPLAVIAEEQLAGRGRDKRSWVSQRGQGFYMSLLISLTERQRLHLLSLTVGVAVCEYLQELTGAPFTTKWPNDILFQQLKIAGVLIENIVERDHIYSIIGVGINLNHQSGDFPEDLRGSATSLKIISGDNYAPSTMERPIINRILSAINRMVVEGADYTVKRFNRLSQSIVGSTIRVHSGTTVYSGTYIGVDKDGSLLLNIEGREKKIYSGEFVMTDRL